MFKGGLPLDMSKGVGRISYFFSLDTDNFSAGTQGIGTGGDRRGWSLMRRNLTLWLSPKLADTEENRRGWSLVCPNANSGQGLQ